MSVTSGRIWAFERVEVDVVGAKELGDERGVGAATWSQLQGYQVESSQHCCVWFG